MSHAVGLDCALVLSGHVTLEEAEPVLRWLVDHPAGRVDWRACTGCHTAVLQVLMAVRPPMSGPVANAFLARWFDIDMSVAASVDCPQ
ncbi:MAG: hypothetical protein EON93_14940 [Burkholderiales bacterium]|nr:MAG: hypothetical protein EON93_14940 [Burkholderiales bacterium]